MKLLVTGGSGFIGSAFIKRMLKSSDVDSILNIDSLSYASNTSLENIQKQKKYLFCNLDICDYDALEKVIKSYVPNRIIHFAAESHVDRSIGNAKNFINTNIIGTYNLLEASRKLLSAELLGKNFIFHHISTDEVYGDLSIDEEPFTEASQYKPSSPYSASKASSDHLVRSWGRTYNINFIITNCSNNFGPFQHPEKFIPTIILKALENQKIPIFGDGSQIRDWLFVDDHIDALEIITRKEFINEVFNIGSSNEVTNINLANMILNLMIEEYGLDHSIIKLLHHVPDRAGHDIRYSVNSNKLKEHTGWIASSKFEDNLKFTIQWYINNQQNMAEIFNGI